MLTIRAKISNIPTSVTRLRALSMFIGSLRSPAHGARFARAAHSRLYAAASLVACSLVPRCARSSVQPPRGCSRAHGPHAPAHCSSGAHHLRQSFVLDRLRGGAPSLVTEADQHRDEDPVG